MGSGKVAVTIKLNNEEFEQLESLANSRSLPHSLVVRSKIVLLAAEGKQNLEISDIVGLNRNAVSKWRSRYASEGIQGLYDSLRSGRPRSIDDDQIAFLLNTTLHSKPNNGTHWSTREAAYKCGISKATVQRVWSAFGIEPHRQKEFKLSNDPFFTEKVRDIVGLYLSPPEKALVLCVDEKSQCQALERTQPVLPMGLGYAEGVTHNYIRHGTTTLFAALDIASGKVITKCRERHRHQEFISFLNLIEKNVPDNMAVHVIMDNYCSHKHAKVRAWFAKHTRFHVHFTPTYSSWLNQVERWFGIITQKAIRRGSFKSTKELREKIDRFVRNYNKSAQPFTWTATADSIFEKLKRLCNKIYETEH
ncbi:MAG: IS630 family transposase [Victivallales bacterium]|nr:IS630 family transposase [Victivallales bacterium]